MRTITILASAALALAPAARATAQEKGFDHSHAALTELLRAHVAGDRVDYKALLEQRAALKAYLKRLEAVSPEELTGFSRDQQHAYWINAYNAYTLAKVLSRYPIESIKDLGSLVTSVWDQRWIPLEAHHPKGARGKGEKLSLNDIEHEILRPRYKDARVHAAINCASQGCPPLADEAYVAERLDEQLTRAARAWLADPARNRYDRAKGTLHLSKVFDWFKEDFVRDAGSVQAWVARYAPAAEAEWIAKAEKPKIEHLDYSWKLNDVQR
jgi:hypothetical protein